MVRVRVSVADVKGLQQQVRQVTLDDAMVDYCRISLNRLDKVTKFKLALVRVVLLLTIAPLKL